MIFFVMKDGKRIFETDMPSGEALDLPNIAKLGVLDFQLSSLGQSLDLTEVLFGFESRSGAAASNDSN